VGDGVVVVVVDGGGTDIVTVIRVPGATCSPAVGLCVTTVVWRVELVLVE
jgi:hypothetical protein